MMRKGIRPGTEKRHELLKTLMEMDMPLSRIVRMTSPMEGKTDAEKEKIAKALLKMYQN